MKRYKIHIVSMLLVMAVVFVSTLTVSNAAGPKVSEKGNKHNLSALAWSSGTLGLNEAANTYQATNDPNNNPGGQQVCIFCHTPHSANVAGGAPLWNREFSSQTFSRYSSQTLRIRIDTSTRTAAGFDAAWQPDGSSKLCLSCHDGVSSLGGVKRGGPIIMKGADVISGIASFDPATNKMKTGHHPISFKYETAVKDAIITAGKAGYVLPSTATPAELAAAIKLDKNGKMQCTTCHNAHQNQSKDADPNATYDGTRKIAPFWVYGAANNATTDHDSVCTACHPIAGAIPENKGPWPWP